MARQLIEFHCTNCSVYMDIMLNIALDGNYRINCPMCDHVHFRQVKKGVITDTRFPENHDQILIEDIRPMKAACRTKQEETEKDSYFCKEGWLHGLWKDIFSGRTTENDLV